jgi:hypothetical protein
VFDCDLDALGDCEGLAVSEGGWVLGVAEIEAFLESAGELESLGDIEIELVTLSDRLLLNAERAGGFA